MTQDLNAFTFVSFDPAYRKAFFDLNKAWLEAHFLLEAYDIEVLSNPEREVLDAGGEIHFGLWGEEAIATFALTPRRKGVMELNKMAVHQNHRGKGIGHLMMNRVMDVCRLRNVQTLGPFPYLTGKCNSPLPQIWLQGDSHACRLCV